MPLRNNDLSFDISEYTTLTFPGAALEQMHLVLNVPRVGQMDVTVEIDHGDPRLGVFTWLDAATWHGSAIGHTEPHAVEGWLDAVLSPAVTLAIAHVADGLREYQGPVLRCDDVRRAPRFHLMRDIFTTREAEQAAAQAGKDLGSLLHMGLGWKDSAREVWSEIDKGYHYSPATVALKDWIAVLVEEGQAVAQAHLDGLKAQGRDPFFCKHSERPEACWPCKVEREGVVSP